MLHSLLLHAQPADRRDADVRSCEQAPKLLDSEVRSVTRPRAPTPVGWGATLYNYYFLSKDAMEFCAFLQPLFPKSTCKSELYLYVHFLGMD